MADAESVESTSSQVEASEKKVKQWTDEEVQKIISERDKTKNKLRSFEESAKKEEEKKLVEDGKLKELLQQKEITLQDLQLKANKYDDEMKRLKESALSKIKNEEVRGIAEKLESVDDINKINEFISKQVVNIDNGKPAFKTPERKFKNFQEMEKYLKSQGLA